MKSVFLFPIILSLLIIVPPMADAHQSGCHSWHSCPSDATPPSYVCGDTGHNNYCLIPEIIITLDQSIYHSGDLLLITGYFPYDEHFPYVIIQIYNPSKTAIVATMFDVIDYEDGSFIAVMRIGGPTWIDDGTYPITVFNFGSKDISIEYQAIPTSHIVTIPIGSSLPGCEETNECHNPFELTIDVGTEVIWSNDDTAAHTITSGNPVGGVDDKFDSSLLMAGATFSHSFDESGTYPYFCMVHPWATGIIQVE